MHGCSRCRMHGCSRCRMHGCSRRRMHGCSRCWRLVRCARSRVLPGSRCLHGPCTLSGSDLSLSEVLVSRSRGSCRTGVSCCSRGSCRRPCRHGASGGGSCSAACSQGALGMPPAVRSTGLGASSHCAAGLHGRRQQMQLQLHALARLHDSVLHAMHVLRIARRLRILHVGVSRCCLHRHARCRMRSAHLHRRLAGIHIHVLIHILPAPECSCMRLLRLSIVRTVPRRLWCWVRASCCVHAGPCACTRRISWRSALHTRCVAVPRCCGGRMELIGRSGALPLSQGAAAAGARRRHGRCGQGEGSALRLRLRHRPHLRLLLCLRLSATGHRHTTRLQRSGCGGAGMARRAGRDGY